MIAAWRQGHDDGGGNFACVGHPLTQGNARGDFGKLRCGIGEGLQPVGIHRRHDFRRDHRVDPDAVRGERRRPYAGQTQLGGFGGDIGRGFALAGDGGFGGDVDDGAVFGLEVGLQQMGQRVIMDQVLVQRGAEGRRPCIKAKAVIATRVVDKAIDRAIAPGFGNGPVAIGIEGQVGLNKPRLRAKRRHEIRIGRAAGHDDRHSPFRRQFGADRSPYPCAAAGDDDPFAAQQKVHQKPTSVVCCQA